MSNSARLIELLGRWEQARTKGERLTPADLCPNEPELAKELAKHIQALHTINDQIETGEPSNGTARTPPPKTVSETTNDELSADAKLLLQTDFTGVRLLGRGGIGLVYVAADQQLHREVAVKFMRERPDAVEEMRNELVREAEITGKLEHPGVVPVYGLGRGEDGRPFYVMRFIRGETFEAAIGRFHRHSSDGANAGERNMEFRNLIGRFLSVCYTVAYAHNRGIIHRDIKPENIMLGKYGETLLVDWGLAMPVDRDQQARASGEKTLMLLSTSQSGNTVGVPVGTPAYMSPEQADASEAITPSTDVYSLGATLYKLLTGELPCKGRDVFEVLKRVREGRFDRPMTTLPGVPAALDAICMKTMARRPADRYASPLELANDIEHWLADEPVSVCPETRANRMSRWMRRHRGTALAAGAGLAAALLLALVFGYQQSQVADREIIAREASLQLAAKFAARMMATEMDLRFRILESEAHDPKLIELLDAVNADPKDRARWGPLGDWLNRRFISYQKTVRTGSWFIDDRQGTLVALSGINLENAARYLGINYAYRDYFHGSGKDLDPTTDRASIKPITKPHLSTVFRSKTDKKLKVGFAVPIRQSRDLASETIGILVMTVDVGDFTALQTPMGQDQMAVLVDTRPDALDNDPRDGLILFHKRLLDLRKEGSAVENYRIPTALQERLVKLREVRVHADQLDETSDKAHRTDFEPNYVDPLAATPGERWMAAFEPVHIKGRTDATRDTGWVVVVQGRR